jgi:hypothetical protein
MSVYRARKFSTETQTFRRAMQCNLSEVDDAARLPTVAAAGMRKADHAFRLFDALIECVRAHDHTFSQMSQAI